VAAIHGLQLQALFAAFQVGVRDQILHGLHDLLQQGTLHNRAVRAQHDKIAKSRRGHFGAPVRYPAELARTHLNNARFEHSGGVERARTPTKNEKDRESWKAAGWPQTVA
jgi:hypothetical protein